MFSFKPQARGVIKILFIQCFVNLRVLFQVNSRLTSALVRFSKPQERYAVDPTTPKCPWLQ